MINFLLTTEIIPLCLRIMESGSELSKTVATFILQKILLDETGLSYICQTFERFSHVSTVLVREGWREGGRDGWREGGREGRSYWTKPSFHTFARHLKDFHMFLLF